ncbi:MAG: hypothetical protein EHM61_07175 [Acidobacteria bacterium]|nr:MAG: hypothetical protein EHM61_07175 [Acidobacteriota bacterium]
MAKPKILFVSPGTGARSLMGKAFARYYAGQTIEVESACPDPKPPSAYIVWAMNEVAVYTSEDHPIALNSAKLEDFDFVVKISEQGQLTLPPLSASTQVEDWRVANTAAVRGQTSDVICSLRIIRYQIEIRVQELLRKVLVTA